MLSTSGLLGSFTICLLSSSTLYSYLSSFIWASIAAFLIATYNISRSRIRVSISFMAIASYTWCIISIEPFKSLSGLVAYLGYYSEDLAISINLPTFFLSSIFSDRSLFFSTFSFANSFSRSTSYFRRISNSLFKIMSSPAITFSMFPSWKFCRFGASVFPCF
jgi:hypothetical protein